jgi:hypothetical protein
MTWMTPGMNASWGEVDWLTAGSISDPNARCKYVKGELLRAATFYETRFEYHKDVLKLSSSPMELLMDLVDAIAGKILDELKHAGILDEADVMSVDAAYKLLNSPQVFEVAANIVLGIVTRGIYDIVQQGSKTAVLLFLNAEANKDAVNFMFFEMARRHYETTC